jgi:rhodanese-related sulfurtransferase
MPYKTSEPNKCQTVIFFVMEVLPLKIISPKELQERTQGEEKVLLLDVRAEEKYNEYHIEDSQILRLTIPKTSISNLKKGMTLHKYRRNNQLLLLARLEIPLPNALIF